MQEDGEEEGEEEEGRSHGTSREADPREDQLRIRGACLSVLRLFTVNDVVEYSLHFLFH